MLAERQPQLAGDLGELREGQVDLGSARLVGRKRRLDALASEVAQRQRARPRRIDE
jgi:hypothetical protein